MPCQGIPSHLKRPDNRVCGVDGAASEGLAHPSAIVNDTAPSDAHR